MARAWTMLGLGVAAQAAGTLVVSAPAFLIPLLRSPGVPLPTAGLLARQLVHTSTSAQPCRAT
jgi:hypothetical protein